MRSCGPKTQILGMCVLWPWPWRYDLGSRSWHTLRLWKTIVWNIIHIGRLGTELWPGHDGEQTDGQTVWFLNTPLPTLFSSGINMLLTWMSLCTTCGHPLLAANWREEQPVHRIIRDKSLKLWQSTTQSIFSVSQNFPVVYNISIIYSFLIIKCLKLWF